jgi:uncharacterized protein (DUF2267 family)
MSSPQVEVFSTTVAKSYLWLKELMNDLDWEDHHHAYRALRAVLHALRDQLSVDEIAQFGAQLPLLIRGAYYEGWDPPHARVRERHTEEFLARIEEAMAPLDVDAEQIARAVLRLLTRHVSDGEIADVRHSLPAELRRLWLPSRPRRVAGARSGAGATRGSASIVKRHPPVALGYAD